LLIYSLIITAIASPIYYKNAASSTHKGRDLVFALDTSGSMKESSYSNEDRQKSKFQILEHFIQKFISKRFDDNVGITVFGSYAFSPVPITYDMHSLEYMLNFLEVGMAGDSTAIGDGLMRSLELLEKAKAKHKVIILVSDGYQNSGKTKIKDAVAKAQKLKVKIYTIGVGKKSNYDFKLLEKIAKDTYGVSFAAANAQALENVFNKLDALEPSNIRAQHYLHKEMLYIYPLAVAIFLLLYLLARRRS